MTTYSKHPSYLSTSSPTQAYAAQTPEWQNPPGTGTREGSSTPIPHTNPWNIGVPGSAAEHAVANMRVTAPFEGWLHESQTTEPTIGNGLQGDSLDGFMDRRSHISPTPTPCHVPENMGVVFEEDEMEE